MQIKTALRASEKQHPPTGRLIEKREAPKRNVGRRENSSGVFQKAVKQTQKQTQTTHKKKSKTKLLKKWHTENKEKRREKRKE
jgi:hypothetical protein